MRTVEKTLYRFHELSDAAKARVLNKAREGVFQESYEWEHIFDDAVMVGREMGFDLMQKRVTLMNGQWRPAPSIFFSGFWSQGDGACFESRYGYRKGAANAVPEALQNVAERLKAMQKPHFYQITASTEQWGHYNHEYSMAIDMSCDCKRCQGYGPGAEVEEEFREICADFARWIYRMLEAEYDYQSSDECLIEMIEANEYEYDEDGDQV